MDNSTVSPFFGHIFLYLCLFFLIERDVMVEPYF